MRVRTLSVIVCAAAVLVNISSAICQTAVQRSRGAVIDPRAAAFATWNAERAARTVSPDRAVKPESRLQLPGIRHRDLELLQDALIRKRPKDLKGSPRLARELIARRNSATNARNSLHGAMAEALFLDRNPEWGYVDKPNARQHDVYRWIVGQRTPVNGQVKFHRTFRASRYAADMRKDHMAHRFFIPDDHVTLMKEYLARKATVAASQGDVVDAKRLWRDYGRVRGAGFTSKEVTAGVRNAEKITAREAGAGYASLGAALALSVGSNIWDWARGNVPDNVTLYRTSRALSILGVGVGTDRILLLIKDGALRGTTRGNIIVGTATAIVEVTWLLYEHGWSHAFYQPEFYEQVTGGISGIGLGFAGGVAIAPYAPKHPVIGPVVIVGTGIVSGTIGYIGGRSAAHMIIDVINPEMIQRQERERIATVTAGLERAMASLRSWKPTR